MRIVSLAIALAITTFPLLVQAQGQAPAQTQGTATDEQILLRQVMTDKRAVYAKNLNLTEDESLVFWPIYDEYEAAAKKLDDRFLANLEVFANMYDWLSVDVG